MGQRLLNRHLLGWTFLMLFFSSSQTRQMQNSVLRVPHLPGDCERQVLPSVLGMGALGKDSVLVETTAGCCVCWVPLPSGTNLGLCGIQVCCSLHPEIREQIGKEIRSVKEAALDSCQ